MFVKFEAVRISETKTTRIKCDIRVFLPDTSLNLRKRPIKTLSHTHSELQKRNVK